MLALKLTESLVDLQLLSPAMSSISSSFCASSVIAPAGAKTRNQTPHDLSTHYYEYDDALRTLLETKPGSRATAAGDAKRRRHAGSALLTRKLSRHAYLIKSVVSWNDAVDPNGGVLQPGFGDNNNMGAALIGKKRRVRLLSDHVQDFNLAVPYSLNRKNRWRAADASASGCLRELAAATVAAAAVNNDASRDERVTFSVVESYINVNRPLGDSNQVTAYRQLDENGECVVDRAARSARGAPLKNLLNVGGDSSRDVEKVARDTVAFNVQYHFTRPHNSCKVMSAHANTYTKGSRRVKSTRRTCYGSIGGGDDAENRAASAASEDDYASADCALDKGQRLYVKPRRKFTLADFIVRGAVANPDEDYVVAYTPRAEKDDIEKQFVFTNAMGVENAADVDGHLLGDALSQELDAPQLPTLSPAVSKNTLARWLSHYDASQCVEARKLFVESATKFDAKFWRAFVARVAENAHATHLNAHSIMFDLTPQYELPYAARAPQLVLHLCYDAQQAVISARLKSAFRFDLNEFLNQIDCEAENFVEILKNVSAKIFAEHFSSVNGSAITSQQSRQRRAHYSRNFASETVAITVAEIIARQSEACATRTRNRADAGDSFEAVFAADESAHSVIASVDRDSDSEDDDFEHIDWVDENTTEDQRNSEPLPALIKCHRCGERTLAELVAVSGCDHTYCIQCLGTAFEERAKHQDHSLRCLEESCAAAGELSFSALPLVRPLAAVSCLAVNYHLTHNIGDAKFVDQCPDCNAFLSAEHLNFSGSVVCCKCSCVFCAACLAQAHWPLTCAQNKIWSEKFDEQQRLFKNCESDICPRVLGIHFFGPSEYSRSVRMDTSSGWLCARNYARLAGGSATAPRHDDMRKMASYLIEFGFAWLYMNRSALQEITEEIDERINNNAFNYVRHSLRQLDSDLSVLESQLLFSGSATDANYVLKKAHSVSRTIELVNERLFLFNAKLSMANH